MAHRLIFDPAALDDLAEAFGHYESISPTLAERFRTNVDKTIDQIAERPLSFPTDVPPIRFSTIDRFPYVIFFVSTTDSISVIAILHGASDPRKWRRRH